MHILFYRLFSTVVFDFRLIDCVVGLQLISEIARSHHEKWALSVEFGYSDIVFCFTDTAILLVKYTIF
jgi:hypothetical protein